MLLVFTDVIDVGEGASPCAIHSRDNTLTVTYINSDGDVCRYCASPSYGQYGSLTFTDEGRASPDEDVAKPCLKRVAHYGAYGFWTARSNDLSASYPDHKFVCYMMPTDISSALIDGSITQSVQSDSVSMSVTLINSRGEMLNRSRALVTPGTELDVYFSLGSSGEIALGQFFVDRADVAYPDEKVSVSARDAVGKLLKEQTFDEYNEIDEGSFQDNLEYILQLAEIPHYFVADPTGDKPLTFNPNTSLLEGVKSAISTLTDWKIGQNADGTVGIAPKSDTRWEQPSVYTFVRDRSCWSYHITYDDADAASRVCVTSASVEEGVEPVAVYVPVPYNKWWTQPVHRTLYQEISAGATVLEAIAVANDIAETLSISGRSETFAGIFTPQLILGDEVKVEEENGSTESVGTVTNITQSFGRSGFHTAFTVDSGGRHGKKRLKDLISDVSK